MLSTQKKSKGMKFKSLWVVIVSIQIQTFVGISFACVIIHQKYYKLNCIIFSNISLHTGWLQVQHIKGDTLQWCSHLNCRTCQCLKDNQWSMWIQNQLMCTNQALQDIHCRSQIVRCKFNDANIWSKIRRLQRFWNCQIKWQDRSSQDKSDWMGYSTDLSSWRNFRSLLQQNASVQLSRFLSANGTALGKNLSDENCDENFSWHGHILFWVVQTITKNVWRSFRLQKPVSQQTANKAIFLLTDDVIFEL